MIASVSRRPARRRAASSAYSPIGVSAGRDDDRRGRGRRDHVGHDVGPGAAELVGVLDDDWICGPPRAHTPRTSVARKR